MIQDVKINYLVNSLYRVEKRHLHDLKYRNSKKFEEIIAYYLKREGIEVTEANVDYFKKKLGLKSNYSVKRHE